MALTGFLKIPDIDGESTTDGHEGEIAVHGFHWSIDRPSASSGRTQARAVVSPITFHKELDASSVYLALETVTGRSFSEIEFAVTGQQDGGIADVLTITMTNCIIDRFEQEHENHDHNDQVIHETLAIRFEEVKLTYLEREADGTGTEHETEFETAGGRAKQMTRVGRTLRPSP